MEIDYKIHRIYLKHTFGISRSKNDWYDVLILYIIDGNIIARGEAAPSARYNESINTLLDIINNDIILPQNLYDRKIIWDFIYPQLKGVKALEAAFSMALWDWWGQKLGKPIYSLFQLGELRMPLTSYTIAIGDLDDIAKKVEEAEPYSILKIKLGTPSKDKEIIKEVRKITDKLIRIDANEGWEEDSALHMCNWLADQNVEFIEQPFPANQLLQTANLRKKSPLDIYADENSVSTIDIPKIRHAFDGINIKLMKCGSLEEAQNMINMAKSFKMKTMLGCMVETSIGITAASHLAANVDCVDLDGNLLIKNDPYKGATVLNGKLVLPEQNGLGVKLTSKEDGLL